MTLDDAMAARLAASSRPHPPAYRRAVHRALKYGEWWRLSPADRDWVREWVAAREKAKSERLAAEIAARPAGPNLTPGQLPGDVFLSEPLFESFPDAAALGAAIKSEPVPGGPLC